MNPPTNHTDAGVGRQVPIDITDRAATTPESNVHRWMYALLRGLEDLPDAEREDVLDLLTVELARFARFAASTR